MNINHIVLSIEAFLNHLGVNCLILPVGLRQHFEGGKKQCPAKMAKSVNFARSDLGDHGYPIEMALNGNLSVLQKKILCINLLTFLVHVMSEVSEELKNLEAKR